MNESLFLDMAPTKEKAYRFFYMYVKRIKSYDDLADDRKLKLIGDGIEDLEKALKAIETGEFKWKQQKQEIY